MFNWIVRVVRFQILFGNIGHMVRIIDEYMIPGPVFRRLRARHFPVPFFRSLKVCVYVHDNATVFEAPVVDQLAGEKLCEW